MDIGDPDFAAAIGGIGIEAAAGGIHHRVTVVLKFLQQEILELFHIVHRQRYHHVEGAVRRMELGAGDLVQLLYHSVPPLLVLVPDLLEVGRLHMLVHGGSARLIEGGSAQTALTQLHGLGHKFPVPGNDGTNAGATGGEPLRTGIHHDHMILDVLHLAEGTHRLVIVDKFPIHLVRHQEQVMLLDHVRDDPHLLVGQYQTGGVAGVGDQNCPSALVDLGFDQLPVRKAVAVVSGGGNGMDHAAAHKRKGIVVGVERLRHQQLIAIVQDTGHDEFQGLTAAGGGQNVLPLQLHAQFGVISPHSVDIGGQAGGRCVFQCRLPEFPDRLIEGLRGLYIRLADIQMVNGPACGNCLICAGVELTNRR